MLIKINKEDKTKAIVIGLNEDDKKAMEFFFGITWGFYQLWIKDNVNPIFPSETSLIGQIYKIYPQATCIGLLSSPDGFVSEKKELINKKIEKPEELKLL